MTVQAPPDSAGGPAIALLADDGFEPDAGWRLELPLGGESAQETGRAARLTIANGFLACSGASVLDDRVQPARRGSVAGVFVDDPAAKATQALATVPDVLALSLHVDGALLVTETAERRRVLDLRTGMLAEDWRPLEPGGPVSSVTARRWVSLADRSLAFLALRIGFAAEADVRLEVRWEPREGPVAWQTRGLELSSWRDPHGGGLGLARASAMSLSLDEAPIEPSDEDGRGRRWRWRAARGQIAVFEALSSFSRADGGEDPAAAAGSGLRLARRRGTEALADRHRAAWAERWSHAEVEVGGDEAAQRALRFALYHLMAAANPDDPRVSIGARGLTGGDYRGHVFWDTEVHLLPVYALTWPAAARTLLSYRWRMLGAARAKAQRLGWRGAFYAWESARTGDETAPARARDAHGDPVEILSGRDEAHISADVAWAAWLYWQISGDEAFLRDEGAEILAETARFWASRTEPGSDGRRHIRNVEGPDEYHQHVDDNAFTNNLARWNLKTALTVIAWLETRWPDRWASLAERLSLGADELAQWKTIAAELASGFDEATGLYEQFAGYFGLEDIDLRAYAGRTEPIDELLGPERIQRSQVIKQADVIALQTMLPHLFDRRSALAIFRHYEPRCAHGSSLSAPTHALAAARLGDVGLALKYFRAGAFDALGEDASRSAGGVHLAALGGLWQTAVFGFAGLSFRRERLCFAPCLPADWDFLAFPIQWRGRRLRVRIDRTALEARLEAGEAMTVMIAGRAHQLAPGAPLHVPLDSRPAPVS